MKILKRNEKTEKESKKAIPAVTNMKSDSNINTDPLGSYTGTPDDPYEKPTQDADDL